MEPDHETITVATSALYPHFLAHYTTPPALQYDNAAAPDEPVPLGEKYSARKLALRAVYAAEAKIAPTKK